MWLVKCRETWFETLQVRWPACSLAVKSGRSRAPLSGPDPANLAINVVWTHTRCSWIIHAALKSSVNRWDEAAVTFWAESCASCGIGCGEGDRCAIAQLDTMLMNLTRTHTHTLFSMVLQFILNQIREELHLCVNWMHLNSIWRLRSSVFSHSPSARYCGQTLTMFAIDMWLGALINLVWRVGTLGLPKLKLSGVAVRLHSGSLEMSCHCGCWIIQYQSALFLRLPWLLIALYWRQVLCFKWLRLCAVIEPTVPLGHVDQLVWHMALAMASHSLTAC